MTNRIFDETVSFLRSFSDPILNQSEESLTEDEVLARARDADALLVFMTDRINDEFLEQCPQLKIISAALKGYDNFDVKACQERGISFTVVPDLLTIPTAELAVGLMLALGRKVLQGDDFIRTGDFRGWRPKFYGTGLAGETVGIIGMGKVGKAVARRLQAFESRVVYFDVMRLDKGEEDDLKLDYVSIDELLEESRFVLPLVPFTDETFHLINAERLRQMRDGSFLVNVSRGSVVHEDAVADALASGRLGGYAADVFEMEEWARECRPKGISVRLQVMNEKTVFTPHIGSAVEGVRREIEWVAVEQIRKFSEGNVPESL